MEVNKIYNENCLDTMARMPDGFIDLTVTSPPYDNLRTYNGYSFDFESIAKELFRVTKTGGVVVWIVGDATVNGSETGTSFRQALYFMECGFRLHDTMIYKKKNFVPLTHNRYEQAFEYMFVFSKKKPKAFNSIKELSIYPGMVNDRSLNKKAETDKNYSVRMRDEKCTTSAHKIKCNVFEYAVGIENEKEVKSHPAIFPERLAKDHIYSWSNKGDLVYDPFMGSGTTAKMAHLLKRNWIGSEISPEYVEIAEKRIRPYLQQQMLEF